MYSRCINNYYTNFLKEEIWLILLKIYETLFKKIVKVKINSIKNKKLYKILNSKDVLGTTHSNYQMYLQFSKTTI